MTMEGYNLKHFLSDVLKLHHWSKTPKRALMLPSASLIPVLKGDVVRIEPGNNFYSESEPRSDVSLREDFHEVPEPVHCSAINSKVNEHTLAIYCYGSLLHEVQMTKVHSDSKTFVDMKMEVESAEISKRFRYIVSLLLNVPNDDKLELLNQFINENFSKRNGLVQWTPNDWKQSQRFLENVKDLNLKKWGRKLNMLWNNLGRKIDEEIGTSPNNYSNIYCSNPFIVPGGRFREFYYWDNYWINRGLLVCEMYETVKGAIRNFFEMVETYGFVPNGGRIYYTRRSQPPFLSLMVRDYVEMSKDNSFIREALPYLEKEYSFWEEHRTVKVEDSDGRIHCLSRYASNVNQPRPESYREDYELIQQHGLAEDAKLELMTHVTSACESGWDFSSRWTGTQYDGSRDHELLLRLKTRDILPVDLNAILSVVEKTLAEFNRSVGNHDKEAIFREKYRNRVEAMEIFMWNRADGSYYDYIISARSQNRQYFVSNVTPLWTKSYPEYVDVGKREESMYEYLKRQTYEGNALLDLPGGLPVSLNNSGQQWDFPNAWPPCTHMVIEGLRSSELKDLKDAALQQAQKYVKTCWNGFTSQDPKYKEAMFEKYNVLTDDGLPGEGGEYEVQEGFGWTNGVAICLLDTFGECLSS